MESFGVAYLFMEHKLGNKGLNIYTSFKQHFSKRKNAAATLSSICQPWPRICVGQHCSSLSLAQTPGWCGLFLLEVFSFPLNGNQSTFPLHFLCLFQDAAVIRASQEPIVTGLFYQVGILVRDPITAITAEFETRSGFTIYFLHLASTPLTSLCIISLICFFYK